MVKMIQTHADPADQGSGMGHEEQFSPPALSARNVIKQETFAGTHGQWARCAETGHLI